MKTYLSLLVVSLVSFAFINNTLAEEDCTTRKGAKIALSREALTDLLQLKSEGNQEGIKKLMMERKVIPIPEEIAVEVIEKQEDKFYNFVIPPFEFNGWALKEDLSCIELVDIPDMDYFPLQVGNMWEYKIVNYRNNEKLEHTIQNTITDKLENEDGSITFFSDGKPYIYKYKEAIVGENGVTLMKLPLKHGLRWHTKGKMTGERMLLVKDVGFTFGLNGTTYDNCIRIIAKSDYHALMKEGGVEYTAFEIQSVYAPDVGLLQTDVYEILRDNVNRTHVGMQELVSFKANQPVPTSDRAIPRQGNKVKVVNSFRFPETHFIHPYLSPNEKWLTYFKSDTIWEELYYTEVSKAEIHLVPVFPQNSAQMKERKTVGGRTWSPDGNTLAVEIELGYDEHISLIDFSNGTPQLIETIRGEKPTYIKSTGELLYLDKFGNIEKKEAGAQPEHLVFTRSSYSGRNEVTSFQLANDGTILYNTGHPRRQSVYLTTLKNPGQKSLLHKKFDKANTWVDRKELSASYDLSPNGKYALFYIPKSSEITSDSALLLDLKTRNIVTQLPISFQERAVWSPCGDMLAFLEKTQPIINKDNPAKTVRPNPHFFVYNTVTGKKTDFGIGVFSNFNWASDCTHIIYSGKLNHETIARVEQGIFLVDLNGSEVGKISSISSSGKPTISTSGKYIIWGSWDYDTFFLVKNPYLSAVQ